VDQSVVMPAQQDAVGERGLAAVGPVPDVVRVGEAEATARKSASAITQLEGATQRRWDRARTAADAQDVSALDSAFPHAPRGDPTRRSVLDPHDRGVTRETPGRFS